MTKGNKSSQMMELDPKGQKTLAALLVCKTKTAAAKKLDISRRSLYERIDKYNLNQFIDELPKQALQTLKLGAEHAAEVMVDKLDDGRNQMEAAKEVLDRVGLSNDKGSVQVNVGDNRKVNIESYVKEVEEKRSL